jgi:hypothetical protein
MSLRLPKVPLVIAALLAIAGAVMYFVVPILSPEFALAGVTPDLIAIGLFGFAFLVFALSFALATPVEKAAKAPKQKKEKKGEAAVTMLGEESNVENNYDGELTRNEKKLAERAKKAAAVAAKKADKESAIASKQAAKEAAKEAKEAAKRQAAEAKAAIKEAKAAERKRKNEEDDDSDLGIQPISDEYARVLTKEEQEALAEDASLAKQAAKNEAQFTRNAQKQAKVAAKLAAKEEAIQAKEEAKKAKEQAALDKINASLEAKAEKLRLKEEAKAEKLRLKEESKAEKLAAREARKNKNVSGDEDLVVETEYAEETYSSDEVASVEAEEETTLEVNDELESDELEVRDASDFDAPELVIPSEEEIYNDKNFVIPFSSPISSREGKMLQAELLKRIDELNDKVLVLQAQVDKSSDK